MKGMRNKVAAAVALSGFLLVGADSEQAAAFIKFETITLVQCESPAVTGSSTSCVASVNSGFDPKGTGPTGIVQFASSGAGQFGSSSCTLTRNFGVPGGSCQVFFSPAAVGTHFITASYQGDSSHFASQGQTQLTVKAPTTTAIACAPAALTVGASATCTATVEDLGPNPVAPTGVAQFVSTGAGKFSSTSCVLTPTAGKPSASCTVTYVPAAVGVHKLVASYTGDATHFNSLALTQLTVE